MTILQKLKQYKVAVIALLAIVFYFVYCNMAAVSVAAASESDGADEAAAVDEKKTVRFAPTEGFDPEEVKAPEKRGHFDTLNLIPSVEQNTKNLLTIPAQRTIVERVGRQRECNKNPYMIAGVQYKQPPVSSTHLEMHVPTICAESSFTHNPPG